MQATRNEENWSAAEDHDVYKTLNGKTLFSSWCMWCMCVCVCIYVYKDPWIICISFIHMSNTFKYCIYDYCITSYKYVEFISWPLCAPYRYIQVISSIIFHGVWCAYVHPTKAAKTKSFSTQQSSAVQNVTAAVSFSTPCNIIHCVNAFDDLGLTWAGLSRHGLLQTDAVETTRRPCKII